MGFSVERTAVQLRIPFADLDGPETGEESALLPDDSLTLALIEKGVGKRKAKELVATYDEARIRSGLTDVLLAAPEETSFDTYRSRPERRKTLSVKA